MTDIEIPYEKERDRKYRFFEILPGALTWTMLAMPLILSLVNVNIAAIFVFGYLLANFTRAVGGALRAMQGLRIVRQHQKLPWRAMLDEVESGVIDQTAATRPRWHYDSLTRLRHQQQVIKPSQIIHVAMIATYKEARAVLEPTIKSVLASDYDMSQVILVLAYEQRGGPEQRDIVEALIRDYGSRFRHAMAIGHPHDIQGEIVGKGGNITFAGRRLQSYVEEQGIDPLHVIVTTLDADNRPDPQYFAALSYTYAACHDPLHASFQPVAMYTNNIWDAPAPMRVVATGNSFFNIVLSLRPHALRNFSAHAQPLAGLIQTDFWSVRTIVEDGHQFWRSYFSFDGNYYVYPIYVPICQDAVLADGYIRTLKAQFIQLRRWTWGASDVAYVANQGFFKPNKVGRFDLIAKFSRLLEGHVTWGSGPLLVLLAGFVPALVNPKSFAANELPLIVSNIQRVALIAAIPTIFLAIVTLPPKPERYKRHRTLFMILQWAYLPVTGIIYNSFAALYSQTRLMFGRYIDKFDVTEKAVITEDKRTIS